MCSLTSNGPCLFDSEINKQVLYLQAIISAMDQLKLLGAIEHHDAKTVSQNFDLTPLHSKQPKTP